jgi:anti-sigma factor RsiW
VTHADIQRCMADYLEGDLSLGKRALFDAHLDACVDCSGELSEMRGTIALLRRLPTSEPPANLADNVMRRLAEGEGQPGWLDRMERWFADLSSAVASPRFALPLTAVAAGLAVVLVTGDGRLSLQGFMSHDPVAQGVVGQATVSAARRAGAR